MLSYKQGNVIFLDEYRKNKDKIEAAQTLEKSILAKHKAIIQGVAKRNEMAKAIGQFDTALQKELQILEDLLRQYTHLTGEELNLVE